MTISALRSLFNGYAAGQHSPPAISSLALGAVGEVVGGIPGISCRLVLPLTLRAPKWSGEHLHSPNETIIAVQRHCWGRMRYAVDQSGGHQNAYCRSWSMYVFDGKHKPPILRGILLVTAHDLRCVIRKLSKQALSAISRPLLRKA